MFTSSINHLLCLNTSFVSAHFYHFLTFPQLQSKVSGLNHRYSEVLKNPQPVRSLLCHHSRGSNHGKTSILKFSCNHQVKLLRIFQFNTQGIESNVSRVVRVAELSELIVGGIGGIDPANLQAPRFRGPDERHGQYVGPHGGLKEVVDCRSADRSVEEEGAALDGLPDEETEHCQHRDAAVGDLRLTVALEYVLVGLGGPH